MLHTANYKHATNIMCVNIIQLPPNLSMLIRYCMHLFLKINSGIQRLAHECGHVSTLIQRQYISNIQLLKIINSKLQTDVSNSQDCKLNKQNKYLVVLTIQRNQNKFKTNMFGFQDRFIDKIFH